MQTHREELVELTLMWDHSDYRRHFWLAYDRAAVISSIKGALTPILAGCLVWFWFRNFAAALVWAYLAVLFLSAPWLARRKRLRALTDTAFAPYTYRFDHEGMHWISPHMRTMTPWASIKSVRTEKGFWRIDDVQQNWMYLPQRTMTEADQAALRAMFAYYAPKIGNRGAIPVSYADAQ
jgi:hypothetical protein